MIAIFLTSTPRKASYFAQRIRGWHQVSGRCTVWRRVVTYASITTMVRSTRILSKRESRQLRNSSDILGFLRGTIAASLPRVLDDIDN